MIRARTVLVGAMVGALSLVGGCVAADPHNPPAPGQAGASDCTTIYNDSYIHAERCWQKTWLASNFAGLDVYDLQMQLRFWSISDWTMTAAAMAAVAQRTDMASNGMVEPVADIRTASCTEYGGDLSFGGSVALHYKLCSGETIGAGSAGAGSGSVHWLPDSHSGQPGWIGPGQSRVMSMKVHVYVPHGAAVPTWSTVGASYVQVAHCSWATLGPICSDYHAPRF